MHTKEGGKPLMTAKHHHEHLARQYGALRGQSLHVLLRRLWGQMPDPRQSLHRLLRRSCSHICDLPHCLHVLLMRLLRADARPQALLALAPAAVMLAYLRSSAVPAATPLPVMLRICLKAFLQAVFLQTGSSLSVILASRRDEQPTAGSPQKASSSKPWNLVCVSSLHLALRFSCNRWMQAWR